MKEMLFIPQVSSKPLKWRQAGIPKWTNERWFYDISGICFVVEITLSRSPQL